MDWYKGLIVAKDPDAVLSWRWDWSEWLGTGDAIAGRSVTVESGITKDSDLSGSDYVDVVLSGGTAGTSYDVTVEVTTTAGLKDHRTVTFQVSEQ